MASDIKVNRALCSCLSAPCRLRSGPFKSASMVSKYCNGQMGEGWMTLGAVSLWFFFFFSSVSVFFFFDPPPFVTNQCPNEAHQNRNSFLFFFSNSFHVLPRRVVNHGLDSGLRYMHILMLTICFRSGIRSYGNIDDKNRLSR